MNLVMFFQRVLSIHDAQDARRFFRAEVEWLQTNYPKVENPEDVVRSNIGWVFSEGMKLEERRMWRDACGAEHPGLGPEYAEREFTADECLAAGQRLAAKGPHALSCVSPNRVGPTTWRARRLGPGRLTERRDGVLGELTELFDHLGRGRFRTTLDFGREREVSARAEDVLT